MGTSLPHRGRRLRGGLGSDPAALRPGVTSVPAARAGIRCSYFGRRCSDDARCNCVGERHGWLPGSSYGRRRVRCTKGFDLHLPDSWHSEISSNPISRNNNDAFNLIVRVLRNLFEAEDEEIQRLPRSATNSRDTLSLTAHAAHAAISNLLIYLDCYSHPSWELLDVKPKNSSAFRTIPRERLLPPQQNTNAFNAPPDLGTTLGYCTRSAHANAARLTSAAAK